MGLIITIIAAVAGYLLYEHYAKRTREEYQSTLLRNFIRLSISAAKADGPINAKEKDSFTVVHFPDPVSSKHFAEDQHGDFSPEQYGPLCFCDPNDLKWQYFATKELARLMSSDGDMNDQEVAWLFRLKAAANLPDTLFTQSIGFYAYRSRDSELAKWASILEVAPNADEDTIKRAYRKKAAQYHPDTLSGVNEAVKGLAEEKFKEVTEAYKRMTTQEPEGDYLKDMAYTDEEGFWKTADGLKANDVLQCSHCRKKNRLGSRQQMFMSRCGSCRAYLLLRSDQFEFINSAASLTN